MSIEIRIHAETTQEALKELAEIAIKLSSVHKSLVQTATKVEDEPPENPTTPTLAEEKVEDAASESTTAPAANSAVSEDAKRAPAPDTEPQKLTLEFVRAAGVEAARKHGKEAVKGILDGLGEAGMTSMTPDKYEAFMRKLGELDA